MPDEYPTEILPQDGFVPLMDIRGLLKMYPALVAVRTCNVPTEEAYVSWEQNENKKILSDEAIGNCEGLSMNLLGGCFDKDKHSRFRPLAERAKTDWQGEKVQPVVKGDYKPIEGERLFFFFYVKQWMDLLFPYRCGFSSRADYEKARSDAEKYVSEKDLKLEGEIIGVFEGKGKPVKVLATAEVNHHPTPMNYWHVQMDCRRIGQSEGEATGSEIKKIGRMLKEIVLRNIQEAGFVYYHIHPRYYKQHPTFLDCCLGYLYSLKDGLNKKKCENFMRSLPLIDNMNEVRNPFA